jgi:hypothetical protein
VENGKTSNGSPALELSVCLPKNLNVRIAREGALHISQQRARKVAYANEYIQEKKRRFEDLSCMRNFQQRRGFQPRRCADVPKNKGDEKVLKK